MMHWGIYSQWECIESWPLVEVDTWARPDDLEAWNKRGRDMQRFLRDYVALNKTFNPQFSNPDQCSFTITVPPYSCRRASMGSM